MNKNGYGIDRSMKDYYFGDFYLFEDYGKVHGDIVTNIFTIKSNRV